VELAEWSAGLIPDSVKPVVQDTGPALPITPSDSFHTAPGYREVAVEYTCIPDSMYPWDSNIMKAIQVFAPDAVPLWVRWVFRTPQDHENPHDVVYGRHALGRVVDRMESDIEPLRVTMPDMPCQGLTFKKPNRIWFIHEGPRDEEGWYVDLPGKYLPFDHSLLLKAEDAARGFRMTDKEYADHLRDVLITRPREAHEKRKRDNADEMDYRSREFHRYADKVIESISDVEIGEYMRSVGDRR